MVECGAKENREEDVTDVTMLRSHLKNVLPLLLCLLVILYGTLSMSGLWITTVPIRNPLKML